MTLPPTQRSTTLVQQVLVSGQVTDSLSGAAPPGLSVRLIDRNSGKNIKQPLRVLPDGGFAFYGIPGASFAGPGDVFDLRIEASAPGYATGQRDFTIIIPTNQPAKQTITIPRDEIPDAEVELFTVGLPRRNMTIALNREPVSLKGVVHLLTDAETPVSGAQVSIPTLPAATTDPAGAFSFPALPVVLQIEITVNKAGFEEAVIKYEPDYQKHVNAISIGLKPE